jgi:hypothetical protein
LTSRITARTRSSNGHCGPSDCSSVVLDEVDAAVDQLSHLGRCLFGGEADAGFDDRADQRARAHARQTARAVDAEGRAGIGRSKRGRQLQVEDAQPRDLSQLEQVAGHGGEQVRQRRPEVGQRPRQFELAARVLRRAHGRRQARLAHAAQNVQALDTRAGACLQLIGLVGQRKEGAARLLAGNGLGGAHRVVAGFEPIAGVDALAHLSRLTPSPSGRGLG